MAAPALAESRDLTAVPAARRQRRAAASLVFTIGANDNSDDCDCDCLNGARRTLCYYVSSSLVRRTEVSATRQTMTECTK